MQRRPPKRGPCRTGPPWQVGVLLNVLVVLSLVLGPVSQARSAPPGTIQAVALAPAGPAPESDPALLQLATDSITPTATLTVTPTVTPTVAPTLTPTPAGMPAEPFIPVLSLVKTASARSAEPGAVVTFTLVARNDGAGPAPDLLVEDRLPKGLAYLPGSALGGKYDPETGVVAWPLPVLDAGQAVSLSLAARVEAQAGETLTNTALLAGGASEDEAPVAASAAVYVSAADIIRPESGGVLHSADGQVEVRFPPGAVSQDVAVSHRPLPPVDLPADQHLFYRFELDARTVSDAAVPVAEFRQPVTLTVIYSDSQVYGMIEEDVQLVHWDEEASVWQPVPSTLDVKANMLTAQLSHFSPYALLGTDEVFFLPRIEAGQVSQFTGDASFSYELEVPAGAGGMKVPLTLQYSSGIPNGLVKPAIGPDINTDTGWVGVGWTLDVGRIEAPDNPNLTMNGLSGDLQNLSDTTTNCDGLQNAKFREHTLKNVQFNRIQSCRIEDKSRGVWGQGKWEVWAKDGTRYTFGSSDYQPLSGSQCEAFGLDPGVACGTGSRLYLQRTSDGYTYNDYLAWKLDKITDPHGNTVEIQYVIFPKDGDTRFLKESYPWRIWYTKNTTAGDNHAEYMVEFHFSDKEWDKKGDKNYAETGFYLHQVDVWFYGNPSNPSERVLVRQYRLAYSIFLLIQGTYWLQSITQYALNPQQQYVSLPATSFTQALQPIKWRADGQEQTVSRPFLVTVTNGYEGTLGFTYTPFACYDYTYPSEVGYQTSTCAAYAAGRRLWSQRQVVYQRSLAPGAGGTTMSSTYAYQNADVKWKRNPPSSCLGTEACFEAFIGFVTVQETNPDIRWVETQFHDTNGVPKDDQKKGRVLRTDVKDSQNGTLYAQTTTSYDVYTNGWPVGVQFVYASNVIEKTCGDGGCQSKKTLYHYDAKWQNCGGTGTVQYGNLTRVEEFASDTAATPYRTTIKAYCPNSTDWIVDRVALESLYEGQVDDINPPLNMLQSRTWYVYSDNQDTPTPYWNQAPGSKGELRGVRRVLDQNTWQMVDTRYRHDAYGNVTHETLYNSYGDYHNWASLYPRTTTTTYESKHHTLPERVVGPTAGSYTPTEVREYYEFNESSPTTGAGLPGQLKRVWDFNNDDSSWYLYDVFGRLTHTWSPGHTAFNTAVATTVREYAPNGTLPAWVRSRQRDDADTGTATYLDAWTVYDGLGRVLQTQAESEQAGTLILTSREYDAVGQVAKESVPYEAAQAGGSYIAPVWPDRDYTSMTYDALGRPVQTINPDRISDVTVEYGYTSYGLYARTWDENDHRKVHFTDPFGRMVRVHEWWGTGGSDYYITNYNYDVADNLEMVTDAAGNTTEMEYDKLGRKTWMSDPDMGEWVYEYNAVGNLKTQDGPEVGTVDKMGFTYDILNRMTFKDYPTGSDVSYQYDNVKGDALTKNSWGRLRVMYMGSEASNGRLYEYDNRGRTVKEQVKIDSVTYDTLYAYDAADRVKAMTYPGGEAVTTVYNDQGLPQTLTGSQAYVIEAGYNALGQKKRYTLGNGAVTTWTYYGESPVENYPSFRLWEVSTTVGGVDRQKLHYGYDAAGNVTSIEDLTVLGGTQTQTFTYDALDRLLTANAAGGSAGQGQYGESYVYNSIGNMTSKGGVTYNYNYSDHKHAVSSTTAGGAFSYDAAGNMTSRKLTTAGPTYTQVWNAENRLASVTVSGATTNLVYDGNGTLVKKAVVGGQTTVYVGPHYEKNVTTGQETKYYFFGPDRVAMRQAGVVSWLLGDHLGSTSLTLNSSGSKVGELRYKAYGDIRYTWGTTPTDHRFTDQLLVQSLGIYSMGARWYDPYLNRFLSPDTIIPQPGNPQSFNRYSYTLGNPLKYRDPSGHWVETAWDVANIGWDIYEVSQDPSLLNIGCLVVDVAAAALPFVPAGAGLIARGGKAVKAGVEIATHTDEAVDAARVLSHAGDMVDASKAIDEGVAAFRAYRGGGIHSASTGKAFSDWFKLNILKNTAATGKSIGSRTLDVVDETTSTIYELKNYTTQSRSGRAFWSQAKDYFDYAKEYGYTLKYVFGQQLQDSLFKRLVDMGIEVWYITDQGEMVRWLPEH